MIRALRSAAAHAIGLSWVVCLAALAAMPVCHFLGLWLIQQGHLVGLRIYDAQTWLSLIVMATAAVYALAVLSLIFRKIGRGESRN